MRTNNLYVTIGLSIIIASLSFLFIWSALGVFYTKVPVDIVDDSLYYYTRSMDVFYGHPFISNPYTLEYSDGLPTISFVPEWIWSAPLFLRFSIIETIAINHFLWFVILAVFLYWFFSLFYLSKKFLPYIISFIILSIYWYVARPISMQIVFPFFIGSVIFFYNFLKNPTSYRDIIFLGIFSGVSVYIYTYLAQIVAGIFVIIFLLSLFNNFKKWNRGIIISGFISLLISIPFLISTLFQINHPFYTETLTRLGLVETHSIGFTGAVYFIVSLSSMIVIFLVRKFLKEEEFYLLEIVSFVLTLTVISNLFTGVDLELANHVSRFIDLWVIMVLFLLLFKVNIFDFSGKYKTLIIISFLPLIFVLLISLSRQVNIFSNIKNIESKDVYITPIDWINSKNIKGRVIFANESLSSYLPLMTNNYVIFSHYTGFHLMSDQEVQDRYLASKVFIGINLDTIKRDFIEYAGVGNAVHKANVVNRGVVWCELFDSVLFKLDCNDRISAYSLIGDKYFSNMLKRFDQVSSNSGMFLDFYNVDYVLMDKEKDNWKIVIKNKLKIVEENERFVLFEKLD